MREPYKTNAFKRDLKRIKRSGKFDLLDIEGVIVMLLADSPLPDYLKDHALSGEWNPARECHIKTDLLLIYLKSPTKLTLLRLGSHSELFG